MGHQCVGLLAQQGKSREDGLLGKDPRPSFQGSSKLNCAGTDRTVALQSNRESGPEFVRDMVNPKIPCFLTLIIYLWFCHLFLIHVFTLLQQCLATDFKICQCSQMPWDWTLGAEDKQKHLQFASSWDLQVAHFPKWTAPLLHEASGTKQFLQLYRQARKSTACTMTHAFRANVYSTNLASTEAD